jgi:hypothetical protein
VRLATHTLVVFCNTLAFYGAKLKLKLSQYKPWRRLGERRYSSYSYSTSALHGGEWSGSRPGRAWAPRKGPPVPIVQEAGWAPEPVWTQRLEEKSLSPLPGIEPRSPGRPARSQILYWLSYPAHGNLKAVHVMQEFATWYYKRGDCEYLCPTNLAYSVSVLEQGVRPLYKK